MRDPDKKRQKRFRGAKARMELDRHLGSDRWAPLPQLVLPAQTRPDQTRPSDSVFTGSQLITRPSLAKSCIK